MTYLAFGLLSFAVPVALVVLYLVIRQFRRAAAWAQNRTDPQERLVAFVAILAIGGFVLGSIMQAQLDQTAGCRANGGKVMRCLFMPRTTAD